MSHIVIIHNNYILGTPAKDYRFKEMMLYNENIDSYYRNTSEKFIWFNTTNIKSTDNWFDVILSLVYLGKELDRTIILPSIYCRSTHNQVKSLLRRYIQQSLLHHREFPYALIKTVYNLNITHQELRRYYYFPQFINREFLGENNINKIKNLLNSTKHKFSHNEYEKFNNTINALYHEKNIERNDRNVS